MNQDTKKQRAATAALDYLGDGVVVGVGTGSTVNFFIDGLAALRRRIAGAVSSSIASTRRLEAHGIPVLDLNDAGELELYVDGADEATRGLHLIKGGGGALTREKIVAAASRRFVCIVDEQKLVDRLGRLSAAGRGHSDGARPSSPASSPGWAASPCGAKASSPTTATTSSTSATCRFPTRWRSRVRSTRSPAWSRSDSSRVARPTCCWSARPKVS